MNIKSAVICAVAALTVLCACQASNTDIQTSGELSADTGKAAAAVTDEEKCQAEEIALNNVSLDIKRGAEDFSDMWWSEGFRSRSERAVMNFVGGSYGAEFDMENLIFAALGAFNDPVSYSSVSSIYDDSIFDGMDAHSLKFTAESGGKQYAAQPTDAGDEHYSNYRQLENGAYSQRFDVVNIKMKSGDSQLYAYGHVEIHALPQYFTLGFELIPKRDVDGVRLEIRWTLPEGWSLSEISDDKTKACVKNKSGSGVVFYLPTVENVQPEMSFDGNVMTFALPATDLKLNEAAQPYMARKGFSVTVIPLADSSFESAAPIIAISDGIKVSAKERFTNEYNKYYPLTCEYDGMLGDIVINGRAPVYDVKQETGRDMADRVYIAVENTSPYEVCVPLVFYRKTTATGISAVLRREGNDGAYGVMSGIPVQISKNWHTDKAHPTLYEGPYERFTAMVRIAPLSRAKFEMTIYHSNFGGVNSASYSQLSLVGWGCYSIWQESALGNNGESVCYEPEGPQCDGAMIDDMRPLMNVSPSFSNQWDWTENIGGGNFLTYEVDGVKSYQKNVHTSYRSYGPGMTDISFSFVTGDGAIEANVTQNMGRTDDIVRTYYNISYKVLKDVEFSRLALFSLGADHYNISPTSERAYGMDGEVLKYGITDTAEPDTYILRDLDFSGENAWAMSYNGTQNDNTPMTCGREIILRGFDAKLGGEPAKPYLSSYSTCGGNSVKGSANWEITPLSSLSRLKAGDYVNMTVEMCVLPTTTETYYGGRAELISRMLGGEVYSAGAFTARNGALEIECTVGAIVDKYPVKVRAEADAAEFSIAGGMGYVPITVCGLSSPEGYELFVDGAVADLGVYSDELAQWYYDCDTDSYSVTFSQNRNADGEVSAFRLAAKSD